MGRRGNLAGALAAAAFVVVFAGCGSSGKRSVTPASVSDEGANVYLQAGCGSCHTLAAAKSGGQVGPNLDQLRPDAATVARWVRYANAVGALATTRRGAIPSFPTAARVARLVG